MGCASLGVCVVLQYIGPCSIQDFRVELSDKVQVSAGQDNRRVPLPVESTGLETRRERRSLRAERQAAAADSVAALEVRLRQHWLDRQQEGLVRPYAPPSRLPTEAPPPEGQVRLIGDFIAHTSLF